VPGISGRGPMARVRSGYHQRGTSTIEFILVFPSVLLVLFAIVELSRAWLTFSIVTAAAREGARAGVVTSPFDPAPAIGRINSILRSSNVTPTSVTVTCSAPCQPGSEVQANVAVTFSTLFPVFLPMLSALPMQQSTSMRYE